MVVINAANVRVTGSKSKDKQYYRHSGYPGGLKTINFEKCQERFPARIIEHAVKGMLPKNSLGRSMIKKLKIYVDANHPHEAQQPKPLELED